MNPEKCETNLKFTGKYHEKYAELYTLSPPPSVWLSTYNQIVQSFYSNESPLSIIKYRYFYVSQNLQNVLEEDLK